jgi:hypothetical protein
MIRLVFPLAALVVGCASGFQELKIPIEAAHATVPISLTSWLVDEDGVVDPSRLTVVGQFAFQAPKCAAAIDISDEVNRQVAGVQGQALVRFSMTTTVEQREGRRKRCAMTSFAADIVKVAPMSAPAEEAAP